MGAGMGGGAGMGVINELLVQMDGFTVPRGLWRHVRRIAFRAKPKVPFYNILVIGATNRASTLDPALVRPGRFDRKIHVGLPDGEGREDIVRYYLAKVRHEPIDQTKLAAMTVGYSPAERSLVVARRRSVTRRRSHRHRGDRRREGRVLVPRPQTFARVAPARFAAGCVLVLTARSKWAFVLRPCRMTILTRRTPHNVHGRGTSRAGARSAS